MPTARRWPFCGSRGSGWTQTQKARLIAVTFAVAPDMLGTGFPAAMQARVLAIRARHATALRDSLGTLVSPIAEAAPIAGLSVMENLVFGRPKETGSQADALPTAVLDVLRHANLQGPLLDLIFDLPLTLGGANLPSTLTGALSLSRAAIKRPDILLLENVLPGADALTQRRLRDGLRWLLPDTLLITMEPRIAEPEDHDMHIVLQGGRVDASVPEAAADDTLNADMADRIAALERTPLLADLPRKQLGLLAFGARWYDAPAGTVVFRRGDDAASGVFVVVQGAAALILPEQGKPDRQIATVGRGDLVGELAVIRGVPRALDMRATQDLRCLRIGRDAFTAVIREDAATAFRLMQVIAGYV